MVFLPCAMFLCGGLRESVPVAPHDGVKGRTSTVGKASPKASPRLNSAALVAAKLAHPSARKAALPARRGFEDSALCSLNVSELDLSHALRVLSQETRTNLVLLSDPGTKLTVRLDDIPLKEMVRHICAITGLDMLKVDSAYVLANDAKLKAAYPEEYALAHPVAPAVAVQEPVLVDRIVTLSNVSASQAVTDLQKLLTDTRLIAVVAPDSSSPNLAIRDTAAATGMAANVLYRDTASDGVSRHVLLRGPAELVESAAKLLASMDIPRAQVGIKVTVHDVDANAANNLGLSWDFGGLAINESKPRGSTFGSFSRAPLSFSASIAALEKQSKAHLIASPNVTVLDGERAFILIGNRLTYPVVVGYSQANTPIFSTQEQRVGIYLQVAARIGSDGAVTLSIYPQVSTVTGYVQINGAGYPQIATREAQTTLRVQSGETIVLGGLMHSEDTNEWDKVPGLSKIPILGELFKSHNKTGVSSEVLITLTPVVQQPPK